MEFARGGDSREPASVEEECLRCYPSSVDIAGAVMMGSGGHTAYYIVKCRSPDGRVWGIKKRFSEFSEFRRRLLEELPMLEDLEPPFPPKTWFSGIDDETVQLRQTLLTEWLNKVLRVCPGDREISMFLAADGSVPDELLPPSPKSPDQSIDSWTSAGRVEQEDAAAITAPKWGLTAEVFEVIDQGHALAEALAAVDDKWQQLEQGLPPVRA